LLMGLISLDVPKQAAICSIHERIAAMNYVNVPVPEHLVTRVMTVITEEMAPKPTGKLPAKHAPPLTGDWTEAEIRKCWKESDTPMQGVLKLLASCAGSPVPIGDVASASGKNPKGHQVAGMMGAFGRRVKRRYNRSTWPFSANYNAMARRWEYTMGIPVATVITTILSE
jgi:hypothetical protein